MTQQDTPKARALEGYLVAAARTGDRAALDQLVRLVSPRLLAHAARLLDDGEAARDVVQTAWVEIIRALPRLRAVEAFRTFALRITTRAVARQIKGLQQDRTASAALALTAEASAPPLGDLAADAATLRAAIDALPPAQAATLALFYLEDLSVAEVAAALDVPQGTVKTRLMHARAALRRALTGDDNDQTG